MGSTRLTETRYYDNQAVWATELRHRVKFVGLKNVGEGMVGKEEEDSLDNPMQGAVQYVLHHSLQAHSSYAAGRL